MKLLLILLFKGTYATVALSKGRGGNANVMHPRSGVSVCIALPCVHKLFIS